MRDYDNIPILDWSAKNTALMAKAQVMHQEPVILNMPASFDASLDGEAYGCKIDRDSGNLIDCNGGETLKHLAEQNHLRDLSIVAEACMRSNSQVDIDATLRRLIIHD
ncbi:MAG: hypothetical protein ABR553_04675 [Gammaproteobacteria bacterium]